MSRFSFIREVQNRFKIEAVEQVERIGGLPLFEETIHGFLVKSTEFSCFRMFRELLEKEDNYKPHPQIQGCYAIPKIRRIFHVTEETWGFLLSASPQFETVDDMFDEFYYLGSVEATAEAELQDQDEYEADLASDSSDSSDQ